MNCIIPFTKEIKFKTNIAEILSISLEHEYTLNDDELLGNFIITGDYKSHEVSVNREAFEYVLPFSVNLTNPLEEDSLDFAIEDFTYDVVDNNTLKVNIEYSVKGEERKTTEEVFEEVSEEENNEANAILEERIENPILENEEVQDEERDIEIEEEKEEVKENITNEENVILDTLTTEDNSFVTYHIHIMKENDTIESICTKYNVSNSLLENYNDLKNINMGDKILIPEVDE